MEHSSIVRKTSPSCALSRMSHPPAVPSSALSQLCSLQRGRRLSDGMELTIRAVQTQHVGTFARSHNPLRTGSISRYRVIALLPSVPLPSTLAAHIYHSTMQLVVQATAAADAPAESLSAQWVCRQWQRDLDTLCVSIWSGTLTDHPDNKMNSYSHHLRPYMRAKSSDGTLIHRFLQ